MDEKQSERQTPGDGNIRLSSPFFKKLDNFWYHYKWHTIVALFLVIAITITATQLASRKYSDVYFLYAGDCEIARNRSDGALSQAQNMEKSLAKYTPDRDGDGEKTTSLLPLFILTNAEIEAVNSSGDYEANVPLIKQNVDILETDLVYSDYYLCLFSESVYSLYKTRDGISLFTPLAPLAGDAPVTYFDESAVYLSSTVLATAPGFCDLPANTVIALRSLSEFSGRREKNAAMQKAAENALRSILAAS